MSDNNNNNQNSIQSKFVSWISGLKNKMTETIINSFGTKEELDDTIDEKIPVVPRVKKYFDSPSLIHRLYLAKELIYFAKQMSFDDSKQILVPLVFKLIRDGEPLVRQTLLEQFFGFGHYMINHKECTQEDYTQILLNSLLRLTAEMTTDENQQTRTSAVEILVQFGTIIKQEEKLPYLIPIIKSLSKDKTEEDHRVQGAILLGRLSESLGSQNIETYVFQFYEQLASDQSPKVKKAVASQVRNMVTVLNGKEEMLDRIYQIFVLLTSDEVWGVRKACCESFDVVCSSLEGENNKEKREKLTNIYLGLLSDDSRWVKSSAYQYLGYFISSFKSPEGVSEELLESFMSMPNKAVINGDGQLSLHCAFSFPAVFLTLGKESWEKLGGLYKTLESDMQFKVRRSLAFSIHEIAKIMGTEECENNLISTFDLFFSDVEEVKIGVITNMASFISVLSPKRRSEYLQYIREIQKEPVKWRHRKLISAQIFQLVDLYDPKRVYEIIYPITINLVNDNINSVRKKAYKGFAKIFQIFCEKEEYQPFYEKVRDQFLELASGSFQKRQSFSYICGELVDLIPTKIFEEVLFEKIKVLCTDRISVVRISLADAFDKAHSRNSKDDEKLKLISSILLLLSKDKDFDVQYLANKHTGKDWIPYSQRPVEERSKKNNVRIDTNNVNNDNDSNDEYSEDD